MAERVVKECYGDQDDMGLVPGEVRAYRMWRLGVRTPRWVNGSVYSQNGRRPHISGLASWTQYDYLPYGQESYVAECLNVYANADGHIAPREDCDCGFYGVYAGGIGHLLRTTNSSLGRTFEPCAVVLGAVAMSGRILFGETGVLRAERMRLEELYVPSAVWHAPSKREALELSVRYNVPVCDTVLDLVHDCPLDDLSSVVPTRSLKGCEASLDTFVELESRLSQGGSSEMSEAILTSAYPAALANGKGYLPDSQAFQWLKFLGLIFS